jgi:hypothetical protein
MTPDQKGAISEAVIAAEAIKLGILVLRPLAPARYDVVSDLEPELIRVQCKTAVRRGEVIAVPCRSCRRGPDGMIRTRYTADEIDAIAAYCPQVDCCYFLPMDRFNGRTVIQLRLRPTRNNQERRINWARDYEFAATLSRPGAIAQLGERLHGMQEVAGSSPAGSMR